MSKDNAYVTSEEFYADRSSVLYILEYIGDFDLSQFIALIDDYKKRVDSAVEKLFLIYCEFLTAIGADRASDNSISQDTLPLFFLAIYRLYRFGISTRFFSRILGV